MRVLIISDSHGRADLLARIVEDVQPDHMIHCGDFCTPLDQLPDVSRSVVRGNCDWEEVADEQVWEKEGIRFSWSTGTGTRLRGICPQFALGPRRWEPRSPVSAIPTCRSANRREISC